jgi:hypothetical protein
MDAGDLLLGAVRRRAREGSAGCCEPISQDGVLLSVAMRRVPQGARRAVGGRPSSSVLSRACAAGAASALTGQRRFVWRRQAVEHSFNGPVGRYPFRPAKPAPAVGPPNGLWESSERAPSFFGRRAGAPTRACGGEPDTGALPHWSVSRVSAVFRHAASRWQGRHSPTRLVTRTKESNACASARVANPVVSARSESKARWSRVVRGRKGPGPRGLGLRTADRSGFLIEGLE